MRRLNGYSEAKVYGNQAKLPVGGYVLKITGVRIEENDYGEVLLIRYDIAEGEYKNFFTDQFNNSNLPDKKYKGVIRMPLPNDNEEYDSKLRTFKTFIKCVEDSNQGYEWNWDENTLRGKHVGGLFGEKEYSFNGSNGFFVAYRFPETVENIRAEKYTIPAPLKLSKKQIVNALQEVEDEEMPF